MTEETQQKKNNLKYVLLAASGSMTTVSLSKQHVTPDIRERVFGNFGSNLGARASGGGCCIASV